MGCSPNATTTTTTTKLPANDSDTTKHYQVYYHSSKSTKCEPETAKHQIAFCSVCSRNQKRYMSQSPRTWWNMSVSHADLQKYKLRSYSSLCTAETLKRNTSACRLRRLT